jgi:hypothetical protein
MVSYGGVLDFVGQKVDDGGSLLLNPVLHMEYGL